MSDLVLLTVAGAAVAGALVGFATGLRFGAADEHEAHTRPDPGRPPCTFADVDPMHPW